MEATTNRNEAPVTSIHYSAFLSVAPEVAWDLVESYTRSEVHIFSVCVAERQEEGSRVVVLSDGSEVRELNVTVDPLRMRAVYTVPALAGVDHHQAEMRVTPEAGGARLEWCTDVLPHEYADRVRDVYDAMFTELVVAAERHAPRGAKY